MPMPSPLFPTRKSPPNICIVKPLFSNTSLSDAVSSLDLLRLKGIRLPSHILATLLRHCSKTRSFREGKLIHLHLKLTGFKRPPTLLANHLIAMYFSCGDFVQARQVFDKMDDRNLFTWNNMLSGYAKLGMMKQARSIFYRMPHKDYVSWNSMVSGYAHRGRFDEAFRFYRRFRRLDVGYNEFSFASVLIVSVKSKEFELCRQIHGQVLVVGFLSNVVISSLIIDAYAKCGKMEDARRLFHDMPARDVRAWTTLVSAYAACGDIESSAELFSQMPKNNPCSWTSLIRAYSRNGMGHEALGVFRQMIKHQVKPDQFTFSTCVLACATIASLKHGKQIHAFLVRNSIKPNTVVISAIVGMYLKCGRLETARRVFNSTGNKQDVELWNTILSTLAHYGYVTEAIMMLYNMLRSGVKPNRTTFAVILNASSHSGLVQEGFQFFKSMPSEHGVVPDQQHYAGLTNLFYEAGCFNESVKDLQMMDSKPDDHVVCRLRGNIDHGREVAVLLIKLQPQSFETYKLLSSIYAALGKWDLVEKIRHICRERQGRKEQAIS